MEKDATHNLGLADIVKKFGAQLLKKDKLSPEKIKALNNIVSCRTEILGWNEYACNQCGTIHYQYNSCGDRHCPKCQSIKQALWVDKLIGTTLPVKHYHIIFTVPHCLNDLCLWNNRLYYKLLFRAVWKTLYSFGYTYWGAETGAVAVLHSWGQNLSLHPHIHCIVPAVGYSLDGKWKHIGKYKNYLYPVHQLSGAFRGAFLDSFGRALSKMGKGNAFLKQREVAKSKKWVVYCEASMAKAEHVIRYLGQYTHRIAISNNRILKFDKENKVVFISKDYRDNAKKKPIKLNGIEFLRRFCTHIVPKGFVRIRRYGIYNHTFIRNHDLTFYTEAQQTIRIIEQKSETKEQQILRLTGIDICKCSCCKTGILVLIRQQPRIRSPSGNLKQILGTKLL